MDGREHTTRQVDLGQLSLGELQRLEREVPKQIERVERERRRVAFEAVEKTAAEMGLSKADLRAKFGGAGKAKDAKPETGYRHPETGQTWAGIGRRPRWVNEFEAQGGDLASIEIRPRS